MFNVSRIIQIWKKAAKVMTIEELEAEINKFDNNTHPAKKDLYELELKDKKGASKKAAS